MAFGLIEYDLIPDVRIGDIARQCSIAATSIYENAHSYSIDPNQIYVSGHSRGTFNRHAFSNGLDRLWEIPEELNEKDVVREFMT